MEISNVVGNPYTNLDITVPREIKHRGGDAILVSLLILSSRGFQILVFLLENFVGEKCVLFEVLQIVKI